MEILSFEEQAELEFIHRNELINYQEPAEKLAKKGLIVIDQVNDGEAKLTEKGLFWIDIINKKTGYC